MKKVEDVFILPDKLLTCPICNNAEFYKFGSTLRNTLVQEFGLYPIYEGDGYICTRCGYRMDFHKEPPVNRGKGERKTPTELKVKKNK